MDRPLFSALEIGCLTLKNRLVFRQFPTGFAARGPIDERFVAYYVQRARGGAGLIEPEELSCARWADRAHCDGCDFREAELWRELADAAHVCGAKILPVLIPSPGDTADGAGDPPILSAVRALLSAGMDGVLLAPGGQELLAPDTAPETLPEEFFPLLRRVKQGAPPGALLGVRAGPIGWREALRLKDAGAGLLDLPDGEAERSAQIRAVSRLPVLLRMESADPPPLEARIRDGAADLVSLDRPLVCDPNLPAKLESGRGEEIRACLGCGRCLERGRGPLRCSLNPGVGREYKYGEQSTTGPAGRKRLVILGGGADGMQAAITASQKGHHVILLEKSEQLGGRLLREAPKSVQWFIREMKRNYVDARLAVLENAEYIASLHPDAVILSAGETERPGTVSALLERGIQVLKIHSDGGSILSAVQAGFLFALGI